MTACEDMSGRDAFRPAWPQNHCAQPTSMKLLSTRCMGTGLYVPGAHTISKMSRNFTALSLRRAKSDTECLLRNRARLLTSRVLPRFQSRLRLINFSASISQLSAFLLFSGCLWFTLRTTTMSFKGRLDIPIDLFHVVVHAQILWGLVRSRSRFRLDVEVLHLRGHQSSRS